MACTLPKKSHVGRDVVDCFQKGKALFSMQDYIKKLFEELPRYMDGIDKTPAGNHLFNVNKITEERAQLFTMS